MRKLQTLARFPSANGKVVFEMKNAANMRGQAAVADGYHGSLTYIL